MDHCGFELVSWRRTLRLMLQTQCAIYNLGVYLVMEQARQKRFCCLTPRAACTWIAAFLLLYGLGLIGLHLEHLERYQRTAFFAAMGLACFFNFARNRTFHCFITGPFFLLVALALALQTRGVLKLSATALWATVFVVVGIAFLLERRFAGGSADVR